MTVFLVWTADEGWTVPSFEIELFRKNLNDSIFCLQAHDRVIGFVSAVSYEVNGWIGNLIVPPERRGRGLGRRLFEKALHHLDALGLRSIWLTASESGQPLYEQYGFVDIGAVDRLIRLPGHAPEKAGSHRATNPDDLLCFDRAVWGESRAKLLAPLAKSSVCFMEGDAVCFLQQHRDLQVIGPGYAPQRSERQLEAVLKACIGAAQPDLPLVIDLYAGHPAERILAGMEFRLSGRNRLMTKGCHDHVDRGSLVSFASLGSMG